MTLWNVNNAIIFKDNTLPVPNYYFLSISPPEQYIDTVRDIILKNNLDISDIVFHLNELKNLNYTLVRVDEVTHISSNRVDITEETI